MGLRNFMILLWASSALDAERRNHGFTSTTTSRIWDCESGRCLKVIRTHTVADIKFDDHQVLSASFDNTIACWEYESGTCWTNSRFSGIITMETNNSKFRKLTDSFEIYPHSRCSPALVFWSRRRCVQRWLRRRDWSASFGVCRHDGQALVFLNWDFDLFPARLYRVGYQGSSRVGCRTASSVGFSLSMS